MEEQPVDVTAADSGLIELTPDNIDKLPDDTGVYLIVAPGQKVVYVGHSGEAGLRDSLWTLLEEQSVPAASHFRFRTTRDASIAEVLAQDYINSLKPPYNVGYGRYRASETTVAKGRHSIRQAAPNP